LNQNTNRSSCESCVFEKILGETLRPGGLELTRHAAAVAGIQAGQTVLDIGCGKGTTAIVLADHYACRVVGIDTDGKSVFLSQSKVSPGNLHGGVSFITADGQHLPFGEAYFDTVISECTLSLISDQEKAALEINRVLKPGGRFILTDIILRGKTGHNLPGQMAFGCCLAGSHSIEEYLQLFRRSGFDPYHFEDQSDKLKEVGFQLLLATGDFEQFTDHISGGAPDKNDREPSSTSLELLWDWFLQSKPGYALFIMNKTEKQL
jgi:arsenite methyltransferase